MPTAVVRVRMLSSACLALLLPLAQDRPLVRADALFTLPEVDGPVLPAGDIDGDGRLDLFVEERTKRRRRVALVTLEGRTVREFWSGEGTIAWDAGGDVDGDGVADLALGLPWWGGPPPVARAGGVVVYSGADGRVLHSLRGEAREERLGTSVAFVGDVDGDGRDDLALGAPAGDGVRGLEVDGRMIRPASARRGWVALYSGSDGSRLWRIEGGAYGHGFGARVDALGDLNGDGRTDLLVQGVLRSPDPALVLSGADGRELRRFTRRRWWAVPAGDVDGDGVPDVITDEGRRDPDSLLREGGAQVHSGATGERIGDRLAYPDWLSGYGVTVALGDLDGDGHGEIGLGEPNFGLPFDHGLPPIDVTTLSLAEALGVESTPRSMSYESGCVWIHSGRTREVVMGIYGDPGSADGLAFHLAALPDVSGDGFPDLVVVHARGASIFPGPGRR